MNLTLYRFLPLFVLGVFLQSCGSLTPCYTNEVNYMDGQALVQLNLSLSEKQLIDFADQLMPDTLFHSEDLDGQGTSVLVKKNGRPALKLVDRTAHITLPLDIKAGRNLGFFKANADGSLFLTVSSLIDIQKDWSWSTQTTIENMEWVKEPKLKIMGLQLSVGKMIEDYIHNSENDLSAQIDQAVRDNQLLQKAIQDAKPSFARSYPLDTENQMYVHTRPMMAGLSPFKERRGRLFVHAKLEGKAFLSKDSTGNDEVDMPDFYWIEPKNLTPTITSFVSMTEEDLQDLLEANVIGEQIEFRGKKGKVSAAQLSLQDGKVKADIHLTGGIRGVAHFEGQPTWDADDNELRFCRSEVELDVQKGFPKWILWLGKGTIKRKVVKELETQINDEIELRVAQINSYLRDYEISPRMRIKADIFDYGLDPLEVVNRELRLGIHAEARGTMSIDNLKLRLE